MSGSKALSSNSPWAAGHGDGAVVSHYFHGTLHDHFRDDRINLARHDGTALLTGRQADFTNAAVRAGIFHAGANHWQFSSS